MILQELIEKLSSLTKLDSAPLPEADIVLFAHDKHRQVQRNNLNYAPFVDSLKHDLQERLDINVLCIATPWSKLNRGKTFSDAHLVNWSYLFYVFRKVLLDLFRCNGERQLVLFYDSLIRKTRAKVLMGIMLPQAACIASRINEIYSVELAHGFGIKQSFMHTVFDWDLRSMEGLPHYMVVYDKTTYSTIQKHEHIKPLRVEHLYLSEQKHYCDRQKSNNFTKDKKKRILVALQWGFEGDTLDVYPELVKDYIPQKLSEFIRDTRTEYNWCFKLHPIMQQRKKLKNCVMKRLISLGLIESSDDKFSNLELNMVFKEVDGLITMHSMFAYEAAYFGVKTLALSPALSQGQEYSGFYKDLVSVGFLEKSPPESNLIKKWINSLGEKKQIDNLFFSNLNELVDILKSVK